MGRPVGDATVCGAGHCSASAGAVGPDGLAEHAAITPAHSTTTERRRPGGMKRNKLQENRMVACGRMSANRLSLPLLGAIACTAFSLWVSLGSLTDANSLTASRLGILPSPWWLVGAFVVAALVGLAVGNRRGILLWLSAVTLLPWMPIPIPAAALIWTGSLK